MPASTRTEVLASDGSCSRFESLEQKQLKHAQLYDVKDLVDFNSDPTSGPEQKPEQKLPLVHAPGMTPNLCFGFYDLARANPRNEARVEENSVEAKHYDVFCSTILNHTVGATDDTRYALACRSIEQYRQTCILGDMLYYMGKYSLIDPKIWSDYNEDPLGHAYSFMQFLLLGEMLRKDEPRNEGSSSI